MRIKADEYADLRDWLAVVSPLVFNLRELPPELSPIATLDGIAEKSPAKAREGLSMAIGDIVEMTNMWPSHTISGLNEKLADAGLPSFSTVRSRFSQSIQTILRRGKIKNKREYCAVRNAVEESPHNEGALWSLLADYERRITP
ncbi:hypothetical protein [Novosphingobium naphthalenivorans]|uniref:hypothetical protein n=1 Tax=Novosphingobium naphthalenivorans TaxID=273168 RepID=UPI0012EDB17F|nr:hypothetical protein [Novosphingobium naphthalenivorans]